MRPQANLFTTSGQKIVWHRTVTAPYLQSSFFRWPALLAPYAKSTSPASIVVFRLSQQQTFRLRFCNAAIIKRTNQTMTMYYYYSCSWITVYIAFIPILYIILCVCLFSLCVPSYCNNFLLFLHLRRCIHFSFNVISYSIYSYTDEQPTPTHNMTRKTRKLVLIVTFIAYYRVLWFNKNHKRDCGLDLPEA